MSLTNLIYRGGTPWSLAHDPEGNIAAIDTAITEVTSLETALGAVVDSDGVYVAHTGTNYLDSNTTVTGDLIDIDTQMKVNADGIAALVGALAWKSPCIAITADAPLAAATNADALAGLLPFSDDDGAALAIGDFSAGDYILASATPKLFYVYDDAGTLRIEDSTGTNGPVTHVALAQGHTFVVHNDLIDVTAVEETEAVYVYDGAALIKIADFDWTAEVDAIMTSMGAVMSVAGVYVAHTTSNYIDTNTDVTEDLLDLDTQLNTASLEAAANTLKTAIITNAVAGIGDIITLLEPTGGGTDAVTIECPALGAARVITIPDADVVLADIAVAANEAAANTLLTAVITAAVAGTGTIITLVEPTGGGADGVTLECPALTGARAITIPDADVVLANIAVNVTGIANIVSGTTPFTGELVNTQNVGVAGADVVAVEYGDGMNHTTVMTLTAADLGVIAGAGNAALGALIYTFPAGAHLHEITYSVVSLQGDAPIQADTPDTGIGSVIGAGGIANLNGTTMEDYIGGFAATDCNGTTDDNFSVAVAGYGTGISANDTTDIKAVHYNCAFNWTGASATLTATGTVTMKWTTMA